MSGLAIGILGSLLICTVLYVLVSLVITGMVRYDRISVEAPLANAFRDVGADLVATLISVGTVAGLLTVMMILMLGQNRVLFAMARDRLIPAWFSTVSERRGVPVRITVVTGVVVAVVAPRVAFAHDFRPGVLALVEAAPGAFDFAWTEPVDSAGAPAGVRVVFPAHCRRSVARLECGAAGLHRGRCATSSS